MSSSFRLPLLGTIISSSPNNKRRSSPTPRNNKFTNLITSRLFVVSGSILILFTIVYVLYFYEFLTSNDHDQLSSPNGVNPNALFTTIDVPLFEVNQTMLNPNKHSRTITGTSKSMNDESTLKLNNILIKKTPEMINISIYGTSSTFMDRLINGSHLLNIEQVLYRTNKPRADSDSQSPPKVEIANEVEAILQNRKELKTQHRDRVKYQHRKPKAKAQAHGRGRSPAVRKPRPKFPSTITDCDLNHSTTDTDSDTDTDSNQKYLNSYQFSDTELAQLLEQRVTAPTTICNPEDIAADRPPFKRLHMDKLANNYAPFVNRCQLKSFTSNGETGELLMTSQFAYQHVFKSGGTTILSILESVIANKWIDDIDALFSANNELNAKRKRTHTGRGQQYRFFVDRKTLPKASHPKHKTNVYFHNLEYWYDLYRHIFYFTFIRNDPIERMLSGFYEMHIKGWDQLINSIPSSITDKVDRFRFYYQRQLNRVRCVGQESELHSMRQNISVYAMWHELHTQPQLLHLLNYNLEFFPFDFVGDLTDLQSSLMLILDEFSDAIHNKPALMDALFKKNGGRVRDLGYSQKKQFASIHRSELSAEDIRNLCELLWMDYICLPIEVPVECDIRQLFVQHYGEDVIYKDCYHVRR